MNLERTISEPSRDRVRGTAVEHRHCQHRTDAVPFFRIVRTRTSDDDRIDKPVPSYATAYGSWPVEYVTSLGLPRTLEMDADAFRERLDRAFVDGLERADPDPEWIDGMTEPWLRADGGSDDGLVSVESDADVETSVEGVDSLDTVSGAQSSLDAVAAGRETSPSRLPVPNGSESDASRRSQFDW